MTEEVTHRLAVIRCGAKKLSGEERRKYFMIIQEYRNGTFEVTKCTDARAALPRGWEVETIKGDDEWASIEEIPSTGGSSGVVDLGDI